VEFTTPALAAAPLGLHVRKITERELALVGDAAGAPDPITGEGMSLSLLSADALAEAIARGDLGTYSKRRRALAEGSEWLSKWILRAARHPRIADRVVRSLAERPELFRMLLEVAVGARRPVGLLQLSRLVIA
jgi:flavin-dependent dehydrogenase